MSDRLKALQKYDEMPPSRALWLNLSRFFGRKVKGFIFIYEVKNLFCNFSIFIWAYPVHINYSRSGKSKLKLVKG